MPERITVYVSIGNSDDKLTQREWSIFYAWIAGSINVYAYQQHGRWLSEPNQPWQNACWCFEIEQQNVDPLQAALAKHAAEFRQDSIAWAEAQTTFIEAAK